MTTKVELAEWIEIGLKVQSEKNPACDPLGCAVSGMPRDIEDRDIVISQHWIGMYADLLEIPHDLAATLVELYENGIRIENIAAMLRNSEI